MAPLALLLACTPSAVLPSGDSPRDSAPPTEDGVEVVGSAPGSGDSGGSGWPEACADLYAQDELPTFDLTFQEADWQGLQSDCQNGAQTYRPVRFTANGETVDAMVRLKGNWSWSCQKLQFTVSFNEEDPDGRFHGLRKMVLDAPWYDQTLMHERLAFPIFKSLGLPHSCVNNAKVTVNGEYYGVYANVERLDREYLERNFEEFDGNLYQAGSELKTNEDVGDTADLQALWAASTVEQVAALVDLDQAVAEWAAEAMIPAMDNYWAGVEINYYIYDHPSRGFLFLPYDLDISFGDSAYSDGTLIWPDTVSADPITYEHPGWRKEPLVQMVLADPHWCGRFVEELVKARAAYDPDELSAQVDEWEAQIGDTVADDPNKTFSTAAHRRSVASLQDFFGQRADFVDAWLAQGGHCPAP